MTRPLSFPFPIPARFAPLLFFGGILFLVFAIYLFARTASSRQSLQTLQKQHHQLLDQKRILEGQVAQLQAEHRQKEAFVRRAEKELSLGEEQQLAASLEKAQQQEKLANQKAHAAELEMKLRQSATVREVEVLFGETTLNLRFEESALFNPGEISVNSSGRKLLAAVAECLNQNLPECPVRVEGHSDNSPVAGALKARFPSSWELTSFRAASVARALQESFKIDPKRLSSIGQAGNFPLESNETREGRARNRRIELIVSLQTFTSPDSSTTLSPP